MLWYNRYQALVFRVPAIGIFVVPPCYFRYPLFVISFFPVYLLLLFVSLFYGQAGRCRTDSKQRYETDNKRTTSDIGIQPDKGALLRLRPFHLSLALPQPVRYNLCEEQ